MIEISYINSEDGQQMKIIIGEPEEGKGRSAAVLFNPPPEKGAVPDPIGLITKILRVCMTGSSKSIEEEGFENFFNNTVPTGRDC